MAFSPSKVIFLVCLLSLTHLSFSVSDVHDLLPQYSLPKGLLPSNIKSYTLSPDSSFTIELSSHPCYVKHGDQVVYYDRIIKGKLEYGKISDVSGIQAKEFIFWLSVTEITLGKNDMLVFHVGAVSTELPSKDFEDVLGCKANALMIGSAAAVNDVHDLLPEYNLPKGLLPSDVKSYSLAADGSFVIELSSNPCYVKHNDQAVYYERIIKGKLSYGKISEVSGIQAKQFIFWFSVTQITVGNNGKLVFHVGAISTELPSKDFEDVLSCKASGLMIGSAEAVNDVHDLLPEFNLPKGLLPSDVKSYSLGADGSFTIELSSHPCYVKHNDQAVYYDRIIKGKLSYGKISEISGIQAKQFIFWLSVTEITVGNNGKLVFHVGAVSSELPSKDFEDVLSCKANALMIGSSAVGAVNDVHDLLPEYNLPKGLLPSDIESYSLAADGSFTIQLSSNPCYVKHNGQAVYYERIIKGKLAYGKITEVSGIQAKQFFFWLSVTEITVGNNGKLVFHVGALSQELPAKDFAAVLACKSNAGLRVASLVQSI